MYVTNYYVVVIDAAGSRLLKDDDGEHVEYRLTAMNVLGKRGWMISDADYVQGPSLNSGWIYNLVKAKNPPGEIRVHYTHFMRKPINITADA